MIPPISGIRSDQAGSPSAGPPTRLRLLFGIAGRLRLHADAERQPVLMRIAAGSVALAYLLAGSSLGDIATRQMLQSLGLPLAIFELLSLGLLCQLVYRPDASAARRFTGTIVDIGMLSYGLHAGGGIATAFYPAYLWVILDNGFRFGVPYLFAAWIAGVAAFAAVIATTEFWQTHEGLAFGLLGGLVLLPLQVWRARGISWRADHRPAHPVRTSKQSDQVEPSDGALKNGSIAASASRFASNTGRTDALAQAAPLSIGTAETIGATDGELGGLKSADRRGALRQLAILLAEDNRTSQRVLGRILEQAGHELTIVESGDSAVDAFKNGSFDVVLMDGTLPGLSSLEAVKLIRFISTGRPRVPMVALMENPTDERRAPWVDAGTDGCIGKPIEPRRLLEMIALLTEGDDFAAGDGPMPEPADIGDRQEARLDGPPAIDQRTLDSLEHLGGAEFVDELIGQFIDDASVMLDDLSATVAANDVREFQEQAHAIRSAAANIGAQGIYELCLAWRDMDGATLECDGKTHVERLTQEFERVREALMEAQATRGLRGPTTNAISMG